MEKNRPNEAGSNVFALYGRRGSDGGADSGKPDYYAIGVSLSDAPHGEEEFFRIHREEGRHLEMCRYSDIMKVYSPVHQLISIFCEDAIFTLEGEHLDVIALHIQERKLMALYLYEPELYNEPAPDVPVIRVIERDPELTGEEDTAEFAETEESPAE
ncbi:MAG: hypothetical protein R3A44_38360 [Caldilineaceae bacterium]